jgi:hypothetical protein
VGPILFVAGFLAQDLSKPDFQPLRQFVSHLSLGPWGWVNSALLMVTGVLIGWFGVTILRTASLGRWGPRLLIGFGASLVMAGMFVIDPGLGYPPGTEPETTWNGQLHDLAGALALVSIVGASIALGRQSRKAGSVVWARYSFLTGLLTTLTFTATAVMAGLDYAGEVSPGVSGLFERVYLTLAMAWVGLTANQLRKDGAGG